MNDDGEKVVLITGASSGMGKTTAEKLLDEGYIVYGAARRVERMGGLESRGGHAIRLDITRDESINACVNQVISEEKRIDILINNAGYAVYGAVEYTAIEDARRQFEVSLFGLARLTQLVLPYMRNQKSGRIINISSMGGKIYTLLGAWYHASKHALEAWSDCLRLEVSQFGIDVVIIEPGIIETEFGSVLMDPLMERSGDTAYSDLARKAKNATYKSYEMGGGSPPAVVTGTISKAIKSNKPKTRYVVGKFARPLIFSRKWLGNRIFDKLIMSQTK